MSVLYVEWNTWVCYRAVVYIAVTLVRLEYTSMGEVQRYIRCQESMDELGTIYGEIEKEQDRGKSHGVYKKCQG